MKKKILLLILLLIGIILVLTMCNRKNDNEKKYENIVWSDLQLNKYLPEPKSTYGEVGVNLKDALSITLKNISENEYKEYKDKCISLKYTIESDETPTTYSAFNEEGYQVRLVYSNKDFYIHLDAPEEMSKIEWPTSGLGSKLPAPNSMIGKISFNNDETFIVHIGETSLEELNNYIKKCEAIGFNIDSTKDTKIYKAFNKERYELSLLYLGYNNIEISLHAPKDNNIENNDNTENNNNDNGNKENSENNNNSEDQKEKVYYSTNDKSTVKNGNSGIYAYKSRSGQYDNYYIIDFDEGYVYFFSDGNGSQECDKVKITSGNLNDTLIISYHDGNSVWQEGLHFKYKKQPDHLIMEDKNHNEFDFYSTNLENALKIKNSKTISNY